RVVLGTDAPVPQLGDRLLVEIFYDGASGAPCDGCRRLLAADAWPISFGVVPPASGGARVRVRLYRTANTGYDGAPGSDRLIDARGGLPPAETLTPVGIALSMRCFGIGTDLAADTICDPATGMVGPVQTAPVLADPASLPVPGTWAPAQEVPCADPVPAGMV